MAHCISQRRDAELSAEKTPLSKDTRRWTALDDVCFGDGHDLTLTVIKEASFRKENRESEFTRATEDSARSAFMYAANLAIHQQILMFAEHV
jgi:hypothetical protein